MHVDCTRTICPSWCEYVGDTSSDGRETSFGAGGRAGQTVRETH